MVQLSTAIIIMSNLKLIVRDHHTFDRLANRLETADYERVDALSHPGQYALAGGNLSIFPAQGDAPIRLDFFGSEIERIFEYDIISNKSIRNIDKIELRPNNIFIPDGAKIKPNDYLVHEDHGIGIFLYLESKKIQEGTKKIKKPYMVLEYLNGDKLFVPLNQKEKVSRYIGVGSRKPRLSKLGSQTWKKTYRRTYQNVVALAKELLLIYAKREISKKVPIKINYEWDKELAKTFGYKETDDQETAISAVYSDLTKDYPMDRLICGDVGYGKTEVAIRAIGQEVQSGNQVAMLVPTTILTEQHYIVLKERFKNLPVRIERLSRFVDHSLQRKIIEDTKNGQIDILVGTHKLLSQSLSFRNLSLLVIDEEQKFGVREKEKFKKLRNNLNVLSLTATPIPRTLFMSLSGIRDISQINTPPRGRREIITEVIKYDIDKVKEAISLEVKRGGQVYYLHNEVSTIVGTQNKLKRIFPRLRIKTAHGQQSEEVLARTMGEFTEGKVDILVCSTIIENGIDLPNTNTLIVESSDRFGLSQLYQIRGRIGRSKKQAYALFTYADKKITTNAFKRFQALLENVELGSGYNIALSDLEIRGGGNILGREQHGSMEAVGLMLYSKLLSQAVQMIKGGKVSI